MRHLQLMGKNPVQVEMKRKNTNRLFVGHLPKSTATGCSPPSISCVKLWGFLRPFLAPLLQADASGWERAPATKKKEEALRGFLVHDPQLALMIHLDLCLHSCILLLLSYERIPICLTSSWQLTAGWQKSSGVLDILWSSCLKHFGTHPGANRIVSSSI